MVSHMIVSLWEEQKQIFFYERKQKANDFLAKPALHNAEKISGLKAIFNA